MTAYGSPERIDALGTALTHAAGLLAREAEAARRAAAGAEEEWRGRAAEGFLDRAGRTNQSCSAVVEAVLAAARALHLHAGELRCALRELAHKE
jgi:uncharacterized protein YukE